MKLKQRQNTLHGIVNANSIVQLVIEVENGMIKHVTLSIKIIVHAKNIIVGILAHVFLMVASI